jgi:hypothetical protein
MENIDPEVFLRIGKIMAQNESYIDHNFKSKSLEQYKAEYLEKLNKQLVNLIEKRSQLLNEYEARRLINKESIEKITSLNYQLGKNNNNTYHHNSTATFLSLRMKKIKKNLNESIANNIANCHELYELEKEICSIDSSIQKTKYNISLNT